jgi:hypothetical protein
LFIVCYNDPTCLPCLALLCLALLCLAAIYLPSSSRKKKRHTKNDPQKFSFILQIRDFEGMFNVNVWLEQLGGNSYGL